MATYDDARSCGGKIVKKNRRRFNPYERPPPPQPPPPTSSSNWFSGVIVPASRRITSGAVKIISSVFDSDDSSSSAASSSGEEDEAYKANDHDISMYGVDELNPEIGTSSKELQLSLEKCESKHVIEQLLMQETFSREEGERLINIINSRVVEQSAVELRENVVLSDRPGDTIGSGSLDLCDKAVTEARNWIKERKVGQSPVSEFGTPGVYSNRLLHIESKVASPVDMAKFYMNARPPWASPTTEQVELRIPSMLIGDGSGHSCSQLKRRSSLASGSWNIHDELRKVRSKATESMLQTPPKADLSSFAPSSSTSQKYILADGVVARTGDNINMSNSPKGAKPVDQSAKMTGGASTKLGFSDVDNREDGLVNEASLSGQANYTPQGKQDSEAIQIEGDSVDPKTHHSETPDHTAEHCADPKLSSENGFSEKEVKESAEKQNANGLPSSPASLSTGGISDRPAKGKHSGGPVEEKLEFLSEASIEVPIAYETGSQNSQEELSQEPSQTKGKLDLAGEPDGTATTPQRKNPSRTSRRGRGRGRGK